MTDLILGAYAFGIVFALILAAVSLKRWRDSRPKKATR